MSNIAEVITEARRLGVLCRPKTRDNVGEGEAVNPFTLPLSLDHATRKGAPYAPTVGDLTADWELITDTMINEEWRKACEDEW